MLGLGHFGTVEGGKGERGRWGILLGEENEADIGDEGDDDGCEGGGHRDIKQREHRSMLVRRADKGEVMTEIHPGKYTRTSQERW